eukprot:gnl/TRDRNA2_/TRDRNA2_51873_c0_seq1.p1 gnl/TRDRNA2_/TRDRNA2_51873_c0~~gnl/TRDRNA2_/TRDRNA2_51873_c0_seq1.p1  ORF type:complete len:398 (+),score=61.60 gnl/TRDRNA2_/TRDRNA2_51873_c0_seq1:61-1194(+)
MAPDLRLLSGERLHLPGELGGLRAGAKAGEARLQVATALRIESERIRLVAAAKATTLEDADVLPEAPEVVHICVLPDLLEQHLAEAAGLQNFGQLTGLQELKLCGQRMAVLPDSFVRLTALRNVELSGMQLSVLPEHIGQLAALQSLRLQDNHLVNLPDGFGNLAALRLLWLQENRLAELPSNFGNLVALQELWLHENQLKLLPCGFGRLKNLQKLRLERNRLVALPADIGGLTALRVLWLHENHLVALPKSFAMLTSLRQVWLQRNKLTVKALLEGLGGPRPELCDHFDEETPFGQRRHSSLQEVWLHDDQIGPMPDGITERTPSSTFYICPRRLAKCCCACPLVRLWQELWDSFHLESMRTMRCRKRQQRPPSIS